MIIKKIANFTKGIIDSIESSSIPPGASSGSKNFLTCGDRIELRRGQKLLGADAGAGVSRIYVAEVQGTQVKFGVRGKKLVYWNTTDEEWAEIGTNLLGSDGEDKDVAFSEYHGLAGDQLWICSPYITLIKIMTANPGSYTDLYVAANNYKGYISIKNNRMDLWGTLKDKAGFYQSTIDEQNYTTVSAEVLGSGDDSEKTFTGTLAFKAAGARRTCFGVLPTDGTETFKDNYDGTLTGDKGGTGTINYTSGVISITFKTAPSAGSNNVVTAYQWEDSTDNGIADFRYSATRVASEGNVFRQDSGGDLLNVLTFKNIRYCFHQRNLWTVDVTIDDTNAINQIFRKNVGIEHWRCPVATGDGIYFIDNKDKTDPKARLLTFAEGSTEVVPLPISDDLDLSDYRFNYAVGFQFGNYILFSCRHKDVTFNNTTLVYNKMWKSWDKLDYFALNFAVFGGTLIAGDSITDNFYELMSGLDDDGSEVLNYWNGNLTDLEIRQLKKCKKIAIEGNIGIDQQIKVSMAFDGGTFVEIGTIDGSGSYVDRGTRIGVGRMTVGISEVGGGGDDILAYHYLREIDINQGKFRKVMIRFEATKLGWADISEYSFKDIRTKRDRVPTKYR